MKKTWPSAGERLGKLVPIPDEVKSSVVGAGSVGSVGPRKTPARNPDASLRIPEMPFQELISVGNELLPSALLKPPRPEFSVMLPEIDVT